MGPSLVLLPIPGPTASISAGFEGEVQFLGPIHLDI